MRDTMLKLWKDEEGPTAVEYALMLFMLVAAIVTAVGTLRTSVINLFTAAAGILDASR